MSSEPLRAVTLLRLRVIFTFIYLFIYLFICLFIYLLIILLCIQKVPKKKKKRRRRRHQPASKKNMDGSKEDEPVEIEWVVEDIVRTVI